MKLLDQLFGRSESAADDQCVLMGRAIARKLPTQANAKAQGLRDDGTSLGEAELILKLWALEAATSLQSPSSHQRSPADWTDSSAGSGIRLTPSLKNDMEVRWADSTRPQRRLRWPLESGSRLQTL